MKNTRQAESASGDDHPRSGTDNLFGFTIDENRATMVQHRAMFGTKGAQFKTTLSTLAPVVICVAFLMCAIVLCVVLS